MLIRGTLAAMSFMAGASLANAADLPVAPDIEAFSYTYLSVEGGWIHFDDEEVQSFFIGDEFPIEVHSIDLSDGFYGRAEIGHVWHSDLLNGIAGYLYGWHGDKSDSETDINVLLAFRDEDSSFNTSIGCAVDDTGCAAGRAKLERSLVEAGARFFHLFGDPAEQTGFSLGIEPFVAFVDEDTKSEIGVNLEGNFAVGAARTSDLDATAFGALIALDGRHPIAPQTIVITRIAAGGYHMDADVHADFENDSGGSTEGDYASDFNGFRGQLALGVEQGLTDSIGLGVIGRLDYWSDVPTMNWLGGAENNNEIGFNRIGKDDLLTLSIGARLTLMFGG
jgi:hypothetical protein